jgi:hypothetical protein
MSTKEIWKDIPSYEGLYQASNLGRIKSIAKEKKKILKPAKCNNYLFVALYKNKIRKSIQVHQLVAMSFLNHTPCGHKTVVNHINFNKQDNSLSNLELVTNRENCNKKHLKSTSHFVGVYWDKSRSKWVSKIMINGKDKFLGRFNTEMEAHEAYQKKLKEIIN